MSTHAIKNDLHHAAVEEHAHHGLDNKAIFGFWCCILTDLIMFAALFATYAVLEHNTFGNIGIRQTASLHFVLVQTLILLTSAFTYGLAIVASKKNAVNKVMLWMGVTALLGLSFLGLEYHQLSQLAQAGHSWRNSAFLSVYFSLIVIHAVHIFIALLWAVVLMIQLPKQKLTDTMRTRLACFGLFWDYTVLVWMLIFFIVYLMGAI